MSSNMNLVFGDFSTKIPKKIVRDLQLQIGRSIVPADFHILEMEEENPLILGRDFLAIMGAVIDFLNHMIAFKRVDKYTFTQHFLCMTFMSEQLTMEKRCP